MSGPSLEEAGELPPAAYAAALASLATAGPGWLAGVLARHAPKEAWQLVLAGELSPPSRLSAKGQLPLGAGGEARALAQAQGCQVADLWERCRRRSVQVTWPGEERYPSALAELPGRPGVLFWAGDIGWVERCPVVSVVGTRRCTPEGARTAYELAHDLAQAGVCVVSGLALGIDGAAHAGALAALEEGSGRGAAATVGVAASGVDVVYPRQHAALWRRVQSLGAVLSETPPGTFAQPWRFPARNRVIAGLARMVVVVESHAAGGSWHTVDAALRAGIEVGAVPGSVRSPASVGTNSLLREGATPVRNAQDVLDALGLAGAAPNRAPRGRAPAAGSAGGPSGGQAGGLGPLEERVLAAVGWQPMCLEEVVERAGLPVRAVVVALERLGASGALAGEGDWWWRR